MKPIAIYGAGGLGKEILVLIQQINLESPQWNIIGFFDDDKNIGPQVISFPVLGGINELNKWTDDLNVVIAIGNTHVKRQVYDSITNQNIWHPVLVHPSVQMESFQHISIGAGTVITSGNILTTHVDIGEQVLINLSCTIGHEVKIGDFCSIMPGCHLSGNVTLGNQAYLGSGAVIINGVTIEERATVGAGAVVIKDVKAGSTEVGVPSRVIHKNTKS